MTTPSPEYPKLNKNVQTDAQSSLEDCKESSCPQSDGNIDWPKALADNEGWMRSKIASQVGEQSAVDDVFQNIALAATKQNAVLRDPSKVGSWLYKLVLVQSALYRRTLGRKRKLQKAVEEQTSSIAEFDRRQQEPLDWLLDEERNQQVRSALKTLSQEEQKILLLKYAEDRSYQEIAKELSLTVSSVQSRLHRARIRLKKALYNFDPTR